MVVEVKMPSLGMTMDEGRIIAWHASEGQDIDKGQLLLEIEGEKAAYEIESPVAGVLSSILHGAETVVPVGSVLAEIREAGVLSAVLPDISSEREHKDSESLRQTTLTATPTHSNSPRPFKATPLAKKIARQRGIDLSSVVGTGPRATIVAKDLPGGGEVSSSVEICRPSSVSDERVEIAIKGPFTCRPLTPMRRAIARTMTLSVQTAPHFYLSSGMEADALVKFRAHRTADVSRETGTALTFTDLILAAVARTLADHRNLNSSYGENGIKEWQHVNISLAVAVDDGLVAPVIRDADKLSLAEIVRTRTDVVSRAKAGKLSSSDLLGGTFGLSNLGPQGVDFFTSILIPGQTGIVSVGAMRDRAVVLPGQIVARKEMVIGLTIDHRAADGAAGAAFLKDLRIRIERGDVER